uniref:PilS cassette n=1 Tax=Meloidogyne hapla TaxID=6305 RepID=A0A1I8BGP5_MELHA
MVIDSNVNGLITMNGVSEFAPCAPVGSGYQFAAPLSGGVFHFGTSTSEASNNSNFCDGLTNRSNVPVRKMLHAKRMKKR